jgi:hypothetical protein
VDSTTGDGRWVFESADAEAHVQNATDKRCFWMALYVQPVLWVVLAVFALVGLKFIWLTLVGELDRKLGSGDRGLTWLSYCACSDDYEYPGVLEVRQV